MAVRGGEKQAAIIRAELNSCLERVSFYLDRADETRICVRMRAYRFTSSCFENKAYQFY